MYKWHNWGAICSHRGFNRCRRCTISWTFTWAWCYGWIRSHRGLDTTSLKLSSSSKEWAWFQGPWGSIGALKVLLSWYVLVETVVKKRLRNGTRSSQKMLLDWGALGNGFAGRNLNFCSRKHLDLQFWGCSDFGISCILPYFVLFFLLFVIFRSKRSATALHCRATL